jgi:hypothetical protein
MMTMYSPWNQGSSSLMRSMLTIAERWNAHEDLGVELRFHVLHAFAKQVRLGLRVNLDVVARGLDPIDLLGAHEEHAAA